MELHRVRTNSGSGEERNALGCSQNNGNGGDSVGCILKEKEISNMMSVRDGEQKGLVKKESGVKRKSIWLPTEIWVSVFKYLARKLLMTRVQLVCRRFYLIAEVQIDNIHVLSKLGRLLNQLSLNYSESDFEFDALENNFVGLGFYFRIGEAMLFRFIRDQRRNRFGLKRRCIIQEGILSQMLATLTCNRLDIMFKPGRKNLNWVAGRLNLFDQARIEQTLIMITKQFPSLVIDKLLEHKTILCCPRLTLSGGVTDAKSICQWLKYIPEEGVEALKQVRVVLMDWSEKAEEILHICKSDFLQTGNDANCYSFAIVFDGEVNSPLFHYENNTSGEVLFVEKRTRIWEERYILRRCRQSDLAMVEQFYSETFSKSGWYHKTKRDGKPIQIIIE